MKYHSMNFAHWLILLLVTYGFLLGKEIKIPFPMELAEAAIQVNNIDDILDGSLIIGNGDINALVYSDSNFIVMNLTKNDVWDARLETVNDPPLPTLNLIKQLGKSDTAFPLKNNNSGYILPEGQIWKEKDSYHSEAYPCPRQCARIVISMSGSSNEFAGKVDLLHWYPPGLRKPVTERIYRLFVACRHVNGYKQSIHYDVPAGLFRDPMDTPFRILSAVNA